MKLPEAKEILDLNIKEAGKTMPPDVLHAVKIGSEAINYIIRLRACSIQHRRLKLPSEDKGHGIPVTLDEQMRIKESPLGREPKG